MKKTIMLLMALMLVCTGVGLASPIDWLNIQFQQLKHADGNLVNTTTNFTYGLYTVATQGSPQVTDSNNNLAVRDGVGNFNALLPYFPTSFEELYIGLTINISPELNPRINLSSVSPYAWLCNDSFFLNNQPAVYYSPASNVSVHNASIGDNRAIVDGLANVSTSDITNIVAGNGNWSLDRASVEPNISSNTAEIDGLANVSFSDIINTIVANGNWSLDYSSIAPNISSNTAIIEGLANGSGSGFIYTAEFNQSLNTSDNVRFNNGTFENVSVNKNFSISALANCDVVATDASGFLICDADADTGGSGSFTNNSDISVGDLNASSINLTGTVIDDWLDVRNYSNIVVVSKSGGDFSTIQAAIDSIGSENSTNRWVVQVMPGWYDENVVLAPYIDLEGSGMYNTIIRPTQAVYGVNITGNSAVRNIGVIADATTSTFAVSIEGDNYSVENCFIKGLKDGILGTSSNDYGIIKNNDFVMYWDGIMLNNHDNVVIQSNTFRTGGLNSASGGNSVAIKVGGANITVQDNSINLFSVGHSNIQGIHVYSSKNKNVSIAGNVINIYAKDSANVRGINTQDNQPAYILSVGNTFDVYSVSGTEYDYYISGGTTYTDNVVDSSKIYQINDANVSYFDSLASDGFFTRSVVVEGNLNVSGSLNVSKNLSITALASCDVVSTDANGFLICDADAGGVDVSSNVSTHNASIGDNRAIIDGLANVSVSDVSNMIAGNGNWSAYETQIIGNVSSNTAEIDGLSNVSVTDVTNIIAGNGNFSLDGLQNDTDFQLLNGSVQNLTIYGNVSIPALASCDVLATDANGIPICDADGLGSGAFVYTEQFNQSLNTSNNVRFENGSFENLSVRSQLYVEASETVKGEARFLDKVGIKNAPDGAASLIVRDDGSGNTIKAYGATNNVYIDLVSQSGGVAGYRFYETSNLRWFFGMLGSDDNLYFSNNADLPQVFPDVIFYNDGSAKFFGRGNFTTNLSVTNLANCDVVATDAAGTFICDADGGGVDVSANVSTHNGSIVNLQTNATNQALSIGSLQENDTAQQGLIITNLINNSAQAISIGSLQENDTLQQGLIITNLINNSNQALEIGTLQENATTQQGLIITNLINLTAVWDAAFVYDDGSSPMTADWNVGGISFLSMLDGNFTGGLNVTGVLNVTSTSQINGTLFDSNSTHRCIGGTGC